jgi:hypothetical protein
VDLQYDYVWKVTSQRSKPLSQHPKGVLYSAVEILYPIVLSQTGPNAAPSDVTTRSVQHLNAHRTQERHTSAQRESHFASAVRIRWIQSGESDTRTPHDAAESLLLLVGQGEHAAHTASTVVRVVPSWRGREARGGSVLYTVQYQSPLIGIPHVARIECLLGGISRSLYLLDGVFPG